MLRAGALSLLCICGLSSLVACVAPRPQEPAVEHTRADCSGCHEREYRNAPQHVDTKPTRCATCHSEASWQPTQLTHAWALTGAHAKADCASCHKGWTPQYEHTTNTCGGCHRETFEKAAAHEAAPLGSSCQDCHDTQAWRPARTKLGALLQLSAARPASVTAVTDEATVATEPEQRATSVPTQRSGTATPQVAPVVGMATEHALRAQPTSVGTTSPIASAPEQSGAAAPSEPAATPGPTLGRRGKAAAGRRARRGEIKNKRVLDTAAALGLAEPQVARVSPAASPLSRGAAPTAETKSTASAKSAAMSPPPPTAARSSASTSTTHSLRSPEPTVSPKSTSEPALRSQPLAAAGRNKPTRSAASQADGPVSQPAEPHAASAPAGQARPTKARAKSSEAAGSNERSK